MSTSTRRSAATVAVSFLLTVTADASDRSVDRAVERQAPPVLHLAAAEGTVAAFASFVAGSGLPVGVVLSSSDS